jgi:hypothetical protein
MQPGLGLSGKLVNEITYAPPLISLGPDEEPLGVNPMRLTLRTLLAYLDDTLEPMEAKLIGDKVAESEAAQELISRIKLVTRRRRLTTPPATGPGARLDANTVAEYLDNALSPEQLAEVEETCIGSDAHLADIAACHQILTLVLGEPILVPPTARQRMYALNRGPESLPRRKVRAAAVGQGVVAQADPQADESDEALLLGLPLYREGGWMRWLAPLATACLLAAASVAVWMALLSNTPRVTTTPGTHPESVALANPEAGRNPADKEAKKQSPAELPISPLTNKPSEVDTKGEGNKKGESRPPVPAVDKTEPGKKENPPPPPRENNVLPIPKAAGEPVNAPNLERAEVGRAEWTGSSILVQQASDKAPWQLVTQKKPIYATDMLRAMPGYSADLVLQTDVTLTLWGIVPELMRVPTPVLESSAVLYTNKAFDVDFKLVRGRVIISNHKKKGPALVRLRFLNQVWDLTLQDPSTQVVAELFGMVQTLGPDPATNAPDLYANVYALNGPLKLHAGDKDHDLTSASMFSWDNTFGLADRPRKLPKAPDWWTNREPPRTNAAPAVKNALSSLALRAQTKNRIDLVLAETLSEPNVYSRTAALRCRAALDDLPAVVDALADERSSELRLRAIEEAQHLLALGQIYDEKLVAALREKNYTEAQVQTLAFLLHGIPPDQWTDPTFRLQVVTDLVSDKLAIRQLAHYDLYAMVPEGRSIVYDATGSRTERDRGYDEWKQLVARLKTPAKPK